MKKMLTFLVAMLFIFSGIVKAGTMVSVDIGTGDPTKLSVYAEAYFISCDLNIRVSENDTASIDSIFDWENGFVATETCTRYQFGPKQIAWVAPAEIVNTDTMAVDGYVNTTCTATSPSFYVYSESEMFSVLLADGWSFAGDGETPIATVEIFANDITSFQLAGNYTDEVVASVGVVPEPVTMSLLAAGSVALLRRKR